ncbi:MAG: exosortase/archaeosortase family protein [Myxococcota bacterium]|nr:exosortase [Deltaproteobacteria bacterium]MCP4244167.1 exosortase/archaeosortase family protein [bacterium]MDP6076276.1 exosortase/archaeosortase family protein [Myxococcota bacterium]MDP6244747.1 exosortase/archaeosortase family protein [Myxococcota bacterium]MDP7073223.1 exosortase/archaeosortase family protein [Myxococcota bacterium]
MTTKMGHPSGLPARPGFDPSERRFAVGATALTLTVALGIFTPIIYHMVLHWKIVPDYSHGFLIAPLAAYFAWERRDMVARTPIEPSWWGVVPLLIGTLALTIGRLGVELMAMRTGVVLTVNGLVLLLMGRQVYRVFAFPLWFLFLMVPLPQSLANTITFPLQLVASDLAMQPLYWLQIPAMREGNIIHMADAQLLVAEACSGLRSVMALGTLGVVFAYFFRRRWAERLVLIVSTLPIAILVNAFRVALTGVLTHQFGEEAASGMIHSTEGFFTFGLAFALLLLEAALIERLWTRWRAKRGSAS